MGRKRRQAASIWSCLRGQGAEAGGYLLVEAAGAALLGVLAVALLSGCFLRLLPLWHYLRAQHQLEDGARHLCASLEKQLGVDSAAITLSREGKFSAAYCSHICAAKALRFYYNAPYQAIYRRTEKLLLGDSGVNPACLEGFTVSQWRLRPLGDRVVALDFTLEQGGYSASFSHVIYCVNGQVTGDG